MRGIGLRINAADFAPPAAAIEASTVKFSLEFAGRDRPPNRGEGFPA